MGEEFIFAVLIMPELKKSNPKFDIGVFLEKWWFKLLEVVAFIVLFCHLIPEEKLNQWGKSGWALVILFGLSILSLLAINYLLTVGYAKAIQQKELDSLAKEDSWQSERLSLFRKARYADVFKMLNKGFKTLHQALRSKPSKEEYELAFRDFCQMLSTAYSHITGKECHVCIKICTYKGKPVKDLNKISVKTLVRSSSAAVDRDSIDLLPENFSHRVIWNTDFEHVFSRGETFFCNNLCALEKYKNSSFLLKGGNSHYYYDSSVSVEHKEKTWPLSYRASIVTPLLPSVRIEKEDKVIYSFLCVDSPDKNSFIEEFDKEILIGCADGIYNPFKQYFISYLINSKN